MSINLRLAEGAKWGERIGNAARFMATGLSPLRRRWKIFFVRRSPWLPLWATLGRCSAAVNMPGKSGIRLKRRYLRRFSAFASVFVFLFLYVYNLLGDVV